MLARTRRGWRGGPRVLVAGATALAAVIALADPVAAAPAAGLDRARTLPVVTTRATAGQPVTYRVFATREGLVGGTTANGHVIRDRDHFVALPSRRGLSTRDGGERTVRVCAQSGRCAFAPVWDVGPWNTTDDYWNAVRQGATGLPRGLAAAQAAYQDGYRGRRDEAGRTVANPAGIDLADGTFWDALRLTDNAWVLVTYLWTGSGASGRVRTGGMPLNLRAAPRSTAAPVGMAAEHAEIPIECQVRGPSVAGAVRTTDLWDRVAPGTYVSHAYLVVPVGFRAPACA